MDVDRESVGGLAHGKRKTWKSCEIQPLAEAHGIAVIVGIVGTIIACAVLEGRCGGNR